MQEIPPQALLLVDVVTSGDVRGRCGGGGGDHAVLIGCK